MTGEEEEYFRRKLQEEYVKALSKRDEWRYRVNSVLLTASVTIFSIVISLDFILTANFYVHILCKAALLVNALCILLLAFSIYSDIHFQDKRVRKLAEGIQEPRRILRKIGNVYTSGDQLKPRFFVICQYTSYPVFIFMVVLYAIYAMTKY